MRDSPAKVGQVGAVGDVDKEASPLCLSAECSRRGERPSSYGGRRVRDDRVGEDDHPYAIQVSLPLRRVEPVPPCVLLCIRLLPQWPVNSFNLFPLEAELQLGVPSSHFVLFWRRSPDDHAISGFERCECAKSGKTGWAEEEKRLWSRGEGWTSGGSEGEEERRAGFWFGK